MTVTKAAIRGMYNQGQEYDVPDNIGKSFINAGQAEKVTKTETKQQTKKEDRSI